MPSDWNSFCRDVVVDSFNIASRDEDNILDQIYGYQICSNQNYEDFNFYNISRKYRVVLNFQFKEFLVKRAY